MTNFFLKDNNVFPQLHHLPVPTHWPAFPPHPYQNANPCFLRLSTCLFKPFTTSTMTLGSATTLMVRAICCIYELINICN